MIAAISAAIAALRALNRAIERALNPVIAVLIALMLTMVVLTVTARLTALNAPWTEKIQLILLPTLAFAVAPLAYRRGANVALDLLSGLLTPRMAHVHQLAMHAGILLLLLVGLDLTLRKVGVDPAPLSAAINALTGLDLSAIRPFRAPIKIPMLNIEWRSVYMVMPASVALMILANAELLLRHLLGVLDPDAPSAQRVRSFEDVTSAAGE